MTVHGQSGLFPHPRGEQQALSMSGAADAEQPALIPPLDMPQSFEKATSYQVRDELQELIGRDLLASRDSAEGTR